MSSKMASNCKTCIPFCILTGLVIATFWFTNSSVIELTSRIDNLGPDSTDFKKELKGLKSQLGNVQTNLSGQIGDVDKKFTSKTTSLSNSEADLEARVHELERKLQTDSKCSRPYTSFPI